MRRAFTLMELLLVVVIIGVMAGFAIPNYGKTTRRMRARDATTALTMISGGNVVYKARTGSNLSASPLSAINTALSLNIVANQATYECGATANICTATSSAGASDFKVSVDLTADISSTNPSCTTSNSSCP